MDDEYYAKELVLAVADLIKAEEFKDVEKAFNSVISRAQCLAREKFKEFIQDYANKAIVELRDEAVQAQGGL